MVYQVYRGIPGIPIRYYDNSYSMGIGDTHRVRVGIDETPPWFST